MESRDPISIIWSRRWLVAAVVFIGLLAGLAAYRLSGPQYRAQSSVMIVSENSAGRDPSANAMDMPALLLSDTVLTRFERRMHWKEPLRALRRRISASVDINSSLMPIGFRAPTADEAVKGANTLAEELRQFYREISGSRYDDLASYLGGQLTREQSRIDAVDRQLETLIAQDPYIGERQAGEEIAAQLVALNSQRSALNATMQGHAMQAQLAHQRIDTIQPLIHQEQLDNDANYKSLQDQLAKDSTNEALVRAQFTDKYPGLPGLADQVTRTRALLQQEQQKALSTGPGSSPSYSSALRDAQAAQGNVSADQAQLTAVNQQIAQAESNLAALPNLGVKVAALRRERDASETAYEILAEQRTITLAEQAQAAALGSITIADRAVVAEPAMGRASLLMPIAAVLGFTVIALCLPFALEIADTRLRRRELIEALYGKPLITSV